MLKTLEELRKFTAEKLVEELEKARKELFKIRFEIENKQSKSTHLIGKIKKYIAKIKTILKEKELTK